MAHAPSPHIPERLQQWLMHQEIYVLDVVVGLVGAMHLLLGLARVDALEDAQAPAAGAKEEEEGRRDEHVPQTRLVKVAEHRRWCCCRCCGAPFAACRRAHLNSPRRSCSFLMALVLVRYWTALPTVPCAGNGVQPPAPKQGKT